MIDEQGREYWEARLKNLQDRAQALRTKHALNRKVYNLYMGLAERRAKDIKEESQLLIQVTAELAEMEALVAKLPKEGA